MSGDARLVARVLNGDREAYAHLVRRYQEGLYRYARALGLDRDTAQDMVQDSLVKAYEDLHRCRDPQRFEMWVFRILRNRCLDHVRNIRRRAVPIHEVSLTDPAPGPEEEAERTQVRERLREALDEMSPDLRDAFLLKHHQERSYEEMAEFTGASVSALKMRVHRARDALRAALLAQETDVPT